MTTAPSSRGPHRFERGLWAHRAFWPALGVLLIGLDYATGLRLSISLLFILPVLLVAWHRDLRHAAAYAAVLSAARFTLQLLAPARPATPADAINALLCLVVLILLAIATVRVARDTRDVRHRLRVLEGTLPICGFCKSIRDDDGHWIPMESYISARSEARFSHGICPKCIERQYGDLFDKVGNS